MTEPRLYLIGDGGHAKAVADVLLAGGRPPAALLVAEPRATHVLGIPVIAATTPPERDAAVIVAFGENYARERTAAAFDRFGTAVHPAATIGADVEIGEGSVIMAGAVVGPGTRIGRHCVVNTGACVDHDCRIEDAATVAPGAVLGGGVVVGRRAVVGLGARVIQRMSVGEDAVVAAGAVVVADVPARVVAVGVPARVLRERQPEEPVFR